MTRNQIVWPMDVSGSAFCSGQLTFEPTGFLVAVLEDAEDSDRVLVTFRESSALRASDSSSAAPPGVASAMAMLVEV